LLWQVIHFLNTVSTAATSPATATPAETASTTIASETVFVILLGPFLSWPTLRKCRGPTKPMLVAAAQNSF
jgi:hypothetical protein